MKLYIRLLNYVRPYTGKFIIGFLLSIIVGIIATSPVPLIQRTFDKIFLEKDTTMLIIIPLIVIGLYLLKCLFDYLQNYLMYSISWRITLHLREELFRHIIRFPLASFHRDSTGELMSRIIYDISIMQKAVSSVARDFIKYTVTLVGIAIWVFWYKWDWAIISLIVMPIAIYPLSILAKKLRKLGHLGQEKMGDISSILQEAFSGIKTVRAFSMEDYEEKRFKEGNSKFYKLAMKSVKYSEISSPMMEFFGVVAIAIFLWYGGYQVIKGSISTGTFFAFITGVIMLYNPAKILGKSYSNIQESLAAGERVFSILDKEIEDTNRDNSKEMIGFKNHIEFSNVYFRYLPYGDWVLNDINFKVPKGVVIAIVGKSGVGKTTMVDLISRFFDVTMGKILIDGIDIKKFSLYSLRRHISIVTQDTFLFDDTIRNNIAYGRPTASFEDIVDVAKSANAHEFIIESEYGYDSVIGERGVRLSGGQRQRLAIARAILKNAPILILDEATSSLDSQSEMLVQSALSNLMKNKTTFIIAHRLSTVKEADIILVMHNGKIEEYGTHESLIKENGYYSRYVERKIVPER